MKLSKIKKLAEKIGRNNLKYESSKYIFDFQKNFTISCFGENTDNGNVIISEADQKKISLLNNIFEF